MQLGLYLKCNIQNAPQMDQYLKYKYQNNKKMFKIQNIENTLFGFYCLKLILINKITFEHFIRLTKRS